MKRTTRHNVDEYLSLRRVLIISLTITLAYYILYTLSHYYGRPSFGNSDNTEEVMRPGGETQRPEGQMRFDDAQRSKWNESLKEFIPGEEMHHRKPGFVLLILLNIPLTFAMVFVVSLFNRRIMSLPIKRRINELIINISVSLVVALLMSMLCTLLQLYLIPNHPGPERTTFSFISRGWLGDIPLLAIVVMANYLARALYREKMVAVENESLRAENMASRYEALENQMDPHFLFNSLNTLKSLIEVDVDKAGSFVHQLSTVLRYTLKNDEVVTLAQELDCVRPYCQMMKMRYGDNLVFEHSIDHEKYDNYKVLPLSIQGLIENAIKHNVISTKQPLTISIMTDDDNHLIVSNKIQPKIGKEEGTGIGLANLAERYRIKWNENVDIFDDGKIFSVTLPLKQKE